METDETSHCSKSEKIIIALGINEKLSDLEKRALIIEEQFKVLSDRASALEEWTQGCVHNVETEKKALGWMQVLMNPDESSRELYNYINVFFRLVIDQMKQRGIKVISLTDLWYKLQDDKKCQKCFASVLNNFDISSNEIQEVKLVLNLIHAVEDPLPNNQDTDLGNCPRTPTNTPREDLDLHTLFLSMQIQDDIKQPMERFLKQAIKASEKAKMESSIKSINQACDHGQFITGHTDCQNNGQSVTGNSVKEAIRQSTTKHTDGQAVGQSVSVDFNNQDSEQFLEEHMDCQATD